MSERDSYEGDQGDIYAGCCGADGGRVTAEDVELDLCPFCLDWIRTEGPRDYCENCGAEWQDGKLVKPGSAGKEARP